MTRRVALAIGILLLLVVVAVVNYDALRSGYLAFVDPSREPYAACQRFVTERLQAPATAQFPEKPLSAKRSENDRHVVSGYVDSQDRFGAGVRTPFECTVQRGAGSAWLLERLDLQNQSRRD